MKRLFGFPRLLDLYVARITLGSFLICFFFIVGLFVLIDLFGNLEDFTRNIGKLQDERHKRIGFFLIAAYYLTYLPFIYLMVAPFVSVTAGMFCVSRLMGANEIVPMLFTGRRLGRVLMPLFLMGLGNAVLMVGLREYVLPEMVTAKDNLHAMLHDGMDDRSIDAAAIRLPDGTVLFFKRYWLKSQAIDGMHVRIPIADSHRDASIRASRAVWTPGGDGGPGWTLTAGLETRPEKHEGRVLDFLPAARVPGFHPAMLRNRIKQSRELLDLSFSELTALVREQPNILEYTVAMHHHLTFPLANLLLLLLALPFALRFERGSKTERVFFALLVCGAYLIVDLIMQNLGRGGMVNPVLAAWFPTVLFGSLGIVMFDTTRT